VAESPFTPSRRDFLAAASLGGVVSPVAAAQDPPDPTRKPNIVLIIADQVRWDAVGAYGINPLGLTPNIDAMARRGTLYRNAFTNHPVCSPSRACLFTGQYQARNGVWANAGKEIGLNPDAPTLAAELRKAGYSANYIGKWHLAKNAKGPVPPSGRGGFLDLWEASNELENTSHPYEGDIYDGDGRPIHFENQYRVDFLTSRVQRFLKNASRTSPFLLVASYLEPHQQNDMQRMVAPKGYAERYRNPFVPRDLLSFPGDWQEQLPDYYGCIKSVDEAVGEIRKSLVENGLDRNTIVVFTSDHSCHFMTRNTEYKRSIHDASIHIPFIAEGSVFDGNHEITESVAMVDFMPTLLSAAGVSVPAAVQGRNTLPLLAGNRPDWSNEVFVSMSEFWVGRGLRTPDWTYALVAPRGNSAFKPAPNAPAYYAFQLYDNRADPHQLLNLAGRRETVQIERQLREQLKTRMQEAGDDPAELRPCQFPYA
jgi:arylsulfatase A-like enzyme